VETAYHPARTVGGDFFQVIPHPDGSLLVVVGDVSGKGVAAAMLVAVLVGALRTRADETFDPAAILQTLNDRLLGRAGGHFATCVAAYIGVDGTMRIANAGHIPPYRNGVAMEIPGSLPLGITAGAEYDVETVRLGAADRLTFVTDGVLEARNEAGELLGFERLEEISMLPPKAILRAAIAHGQDDDITVVGVRLLARAAQATDPALLAGAPA
jgi:serine phosphatase RsbU (regulator of sigma subunit)